MRVMATAEPEPVSNPTGLECVANPQEFFFFISLFLQEAFYNTSAVGRDFCSSNSHGTRTHVVNPRFVSPEEPMLDL